MSSLEMVPLMKVGEGATSDGLAVDLGALFCVAGDASAVAALLTAVA